MSAGGARSGKEVDPLAHLHPAEAAADLFHQLGRFGFSGEEGTVTAHAMTARWIEVAARSYWQRLSNTNWPHIILAEIMRNPHISGLRFSNEQDRASANLPSFNATRFQRGPKKIVVLKTILSGTNELTRK